MNNSWEEVVVIGYGNHAKTKIIPAIENAFRSKVSLVTNKNLIDKKKYKIYSSLEDAFSKNTNKLFVVCNPPVLHYEYCKKILEMGFDVFVEKPGFIKYEQLRELISITKKKGLVLYEMFMYLENESVKETFNLINDNLNEINSIYSSFTLPSYPDSTFRDESEFSSSLFLDMICYYTSFSYHLKENIKEININNDSFLDFKNPLYKVGFKGERFLLDISIGIKEIYSNVLNVSFNDGSFLEVSPFFYGRESFINISKKMDNKSIRYKKFEKNAFEKIFLKARNQLICTQDKRFEEMLLSQLLLNKLKKKWYKLIH